LSEAESPVRKPTIEDVRALLGPATPHFALQVRNRIARLIAGLPDDDPARRYGEREIARLTELGFAGETRGIPGEPDLAPLASVGGHQGVTVPGPAPAAPHPTPEQRDREFPGVAGA
jgi:hypothetical protein